MLCQICKKREATVKHTAVVGGKACVQQLCEYCANELFGEFESKMQDAYFAGLFDDGFREERACPVCGLTFSEYEQGGLLGCPSCYDFFKEEILPYIARIQGKTVHVGKRGGEYTSEHDVHIKLSTLQEAMEAALSRGDYTEAGRINEQMNAIKKRTTGGWRW